MFKTEFENLRRTCPLIHNITNYVTVNDCANMVLACGASPIMADDAAEVEDKGHRHSSLQVVQMKKRFDTSVCQMV